MGCTSNNVVAKHGPDAVTWDMFEHFMHEQYGLLQPATEIRSAYDELHQSDFDTVSAFVREFRLKERELVGTPYHPGGGAIIDFIKKLTPAVRKYVQDNAPEGWWTDVKQVYMKALNYELNQWCAVQVDNRPANVAAPVREQLQKSSMQADLSDDGSECGSDSDSYSEKDDDEAVHDQDSGRKRMRTAKTVWESWKDSRTCFRCGEPGHIAQNCKADLD